MKAVGDAAKGEGFNKWFNEMWEQGKTGAARGDADVGYGEWLSPQPVWPGHQRRRPGSAAEAIDAQLVRYQEPGAVGGFGGDLVSGHVESFAGSTDSGMQYGDVREAYTETMIGVDEQDHHKRQKFRNVDEIMRHRKFDDKQYGGKDQTGSSTE